MGRIKSFVKHDLMNQIEKWRYKELKDSETTGFNDKGIFEAKGGGKAILIKADTNDCDYITSRNEAISEALESQMPSVFESVRVYKNSISVTQDASTKNAESFSYSGI